MKSTHLSQAIRSHVVRMANSGGGSHVGSALSIADILGVLYSGVLRVDPANPAWADRDRLILSKGHAGAAIYAALAETGFFPIEKLKTHYQNGSELSGHVSHKNNPGVELSTGSLGHGLPVASGIAYSGKLDSREFRVFVVLSDGECDEGSNWESILFAGHHRLSNLVAIIDYNKLQSLGRCEDTLALEPFADKWTSFGWRTIEVDGHDHSALERALTASSEGKPTCVIAHTTKGKGVSFMENSVLWHYRVPRGDEFQNALSELGVAE